MKVSIGKSPLRLCTLCIGADFCQWREIGEAGGLLLGAARWITVALCAAVFRR